MEEDDYYPKTLEEELNEISEAFFALVGEDGIQKYQKYVEGCQQRRISQNALRPPSMAPNFELTDQDDEVVNLKELLERGPVVLVFYRGKWCPTCNATLMRFQRHIDEIKDKGATLVAVSPMLPDGTQFMSDKKSIRYPVLSDVGNGVARKFNITFIVPEEIRPQMLQFGQDVPEHNGDDTWEIPLAATFVISQSGEIVGSFVDDNPATVRAEISDIVAAIPSAKKADNEGEAVDNVPREEQMKDVALRRDDSRARRMVFLMKRSFKSLFRNNNEKAKKTETSTKRSFKNLFVKKKKQDSKKHTFGKKKEEPMQFLSRYICQD